ncbi:lytic transglycosylase domain-containing protein [Synechococcus sp. GreenBA-s]|nr:lytic transglycosylase domain-containing protein [Synechococcus sp. GreenBA-s]
MLIGLTCLGTGLALAVGRQLLSQRAAALDPTTPAAELERLRHVSADPERRREAALLLSARPETPPARQVLLLRGQGWGRDPLAAVALKRSAEAAAAAGQAPLAEALWGELLEHFPQQPASADALYALGRDRPPLRQRLLRRFPAHPAALAAALEQGAAVHLARWGPRWPGAEPLLRQACAAEGPRPSPAERSQLAAGLAQLGDGAAAVACLRGTRGSAPLELSLGKALLKGEAPAQGDARLLALARRLPASPEALEATALLSQQQDPAALARLAQLPPSLQDSAPVQARLALERRRPWRGVLQRWPRDPASWDLQWELARAAALKGQWGEVSTLLAALRPDQLPAPLAARQLFWQGLAAENQGDRAGAERFWRQVLPLAPGGYYGWRARVRLGELEERDPRDPQATAAGPGAAAGARELPWQPLASGDPLLDRLWRLDLPLEAWELWRTRRGGRPPEGPGQLLLEGRLRTGIGDDWTGLGQLDQAALRLPAGSCRVQWQREQQLHPRRYGSAFAQAAAQAGLDPNLLFGVARQESRFTAGVSSAVGAVGLLQLMPATAAEVAGEPQSLEALKQPERNTALGARYLRQLLDQWQGAPFLAVASYNAGPGAVAGWLGAGRPDPRREPELWTEAIPYPETRLYTKKVLGNAWSYSLPEEPGC